MPKYSAKVEDESKVAKTRGSYLRVHYKVWDSAQRRTTERERENE